MVFQMQEQSNCSSDKAGASTSQMMSEGNSSNIVDPLKPGHLTELGAADGNKATNPNETLGSDNSDESKSGSDTPMALDEQIAHATQTQDRLLKQRQLENINQKIKVLEQEH